MSADIMQQLAANKSAQEAQNAQNGAGAMVGFGILLKNSPSMPHVGISLNVGGQWTKTAVVPQARDLLNSRMMSGLFSSKGQAWNLSKGAPDLQFLTGGMGMVAPGIEMGDPSMGTPGSGRGFGAALYGQGVAATEISSGYTDTSQIALPS